jgi:hypothetical protein
MSGIQLSDEATPGKKRKRKSEKNNRKARQEKPCVDCVS